MAKYELTTNGERCTLTDTENGVTVDWIKGDFYGTQESEADTDGPLYRGRSAADALAALYSVRREMYDYVAVTRPELL